MPIAQLGSNYQALFLGGIMATTKEDIRLWLKKGNTENNTHMIVVTDTFDYEDFPVYVTSKENVNEKIKENQNREKMLKVMEVYKYSIDLEKQIQERRAWNI